MLELAGIDVSWSRPDPAGIFRCGYRFVIGYLSHDLSKIVDAAHLAGWRLAGLAVGLVFEDGAARVLDGAAAGAADGALAEAQANAAGYPVDAVIFAAVDFPASASQFPRIRDYMVGFDSATRRPVGVYGSHDVVEALTTPGQRPVRYGWQTAAWSGGLLSGKASIYQRVGHPNWPLIPGVGAGDFDENVITGPVPLAGGVLAPPGAVPSPIPATPAQPAPKPRPVQPAGGGVAAGFRCTQGQTSPAIARLQTFLRDNFGAYAGGLPSTGFYGPQTAAAVREFAHRSGIPTADGTNVGPLIAAALEHDGFGG